MKKEIYIDFDGTIVDTISRIVEMYNEDYSYYENFTPVHADEIKTWNFDELKLSNRKAINLYFSQPRFFNDGLKPMKWAIEVINKLHNEGYKIKIVSAGTGPNLRIKKAWLKNHLEFDEFIGVDLNRHKNKDHIDMSECFFIDDMDQNLKGSNAKYKICYGLEYDWNTDWKQTRAYTWEEVYKIIKDTEKKELESEEDYYGE